MKSKKVLIPIVLLAIIAATWAAIPKVVGKTVRNKAEERGYQVEWASLEWSRREVTLHGVRVTGTWMTGNFETVTAGLDGADLKSLNVRNGHVDANLAKKPKSGGGGGKVAVSVEGLTVEVQGLCGSGRARATGLGKAVDGRVWAERAFAECAEWYVEAEEVKKDARKVSAGSVSVRPGEAPASLQAPADVKKADAVTEWVPEEVTIGDLKAEAHGASVHANEVTVRPSLEGVEATADKVVAEVVQEWGAMTAKGVKASVSKDKTSFSASAESVGGSVGALSKDRMEAGSVSVSGRLKRKDGTIEASTVLLQVGTVKASIEAAYKDTKNFRLTAELGTTPCQDVLDSVPKGFMEAMDGFSFKGTVQSSVRIEGEAGKFDVKLGLTNKCRADKIPEAMSVKAFSKRFKRSVPGVKGDIEMESGSGSESWTALGRVSPFMAKAILTCEDTGFFVHHGFVTGSLENSIRENLEAGKFVRGGSTVSMQLAKNLWLTRTKTISRKAQEFFLTTYLEQALTKQEIMELYLNVVEFGPDVYGIRQAATYYFNKEPEDITLAESAFLASILPSPKKDRFSADRTLSAGWNPYVQHIMKTMRTRDLISEQEEQEGLAETVTRGESKSGGLSPIRVAPGGVDPLSWK